MKIKQEGDRVRFYPECSRDLVDAGFMLAVFKDKSIHFEALQDKNSPMWIEFLEVPISSLMHVVCNKGYIGRMVSS